MFTAIIRLRLVIVTLFLKKDKTENIMKKNNLPTTDYEMLLPATLESQSKSIQKSVTLNALLHQDDNHHFTMQNLKSSESHGSPVVKANVECHPSACDLWVQCDKCKKWHMLPDETDPASLPDKWYCKMNKTFVSKLRFAVQ